MIFTNEYIAEITAELLKILPDCDVAHVGSSFITGDGADLDLVVFDSGPRFAGKLVLLGAGYRYTGIDEGYDDDGFQTYRRDNVNIMLTDSRDFFNGFITASEVCRFLHLQYSFGDKTTRIGVHRIIMNEESADEVQEYLRGRSEATGQ